MADMATAPVIAIRADGTPMIGSGHIRRVGILAGHLRECGLFPVLLCNPEAPDLFPDALQSFTAVHCISDEAAARTLLADRYPQGIAGVFFDHYGLDATDHRRYRSIATHLSGIDDLANRPLDWDILFDINLGRSPADYASLLPPQTAIHTGRDYQIVRPEFLERRDACLKERAARGPRLERVLIATGGTDPHAITHTLLNITAAALPDVEIDVVSGSASPQLALLRAAVARLGPRVALHVDTPDVANLMCRADLAIGAGGTMTWERNMLGLPSIILIIADNQEMVGRVMARERAALVIDLRAIHNPRTLADHLTLFRNAPEDLAFVSHRAAMLSGADGARNMARILCNALAANP
ncbi:MAG: UDP-2,4-diacetamido-2,4,6-trideoxy-beta-L-altropyranose hydrolase [Pseudomonadota bacterium]